MIEHLIMAVQETNGKRAAVLGFPLEQALSKKEYMLHSDAKLPINQQGTLPDNSNYLRFGSLQDAVRQLNSELDDFDLFFAANQSAMHAGFGELSYAEWLCWHGKHFTHHFK